MNLDDIEKGLDALDTGIWVGDHESPFLKGVRLKVRRLWNDDYAQLYSELTAALPRDDKGDISVEDERKATDECLKKTVLLDWDGLDTPCTAETVALVYGKPKVWRILRTATILSANRAADVYLKSLETDAKN